MSALWRINLLVTLFFTLVTLVCLAVLLRQASHDVQRELNAAAAVVGYLGEMAERDPESLRPGLTDSLRHVRVRWLEADLVGADAADPVRSDWLGAWLYPAELSAPTVLQLPNGRRLHISVDPSDEVEEVRDSLVQLVVLFGLALLLCLLAIRWALRPGMRVLAELFGALVRIADGRLDTRLPPHRFAEARELAEHFNHMAAALEDARLDNERLTQALLALQERERTRLAQALHDDLGQYLAGIRARACLLRVQADQPSAIRETAAHLEQHSLDLQNGFRTLVRDLYPVMLDHLSLEDAIGQLAEQWQSTQGIACEVRLRGPIPDLSMDAKVHLYRMVQEALTNVARHARATRVCLDLRGDPLGLRLLIRDDGHGQPAERPGVGLRSMVEHARCLGARLRVRHRAGKGWALYLKLPLQGAMS
ncbi:sensor histidine kinase LiaS [Pseudomonas sp. SCT]|jgi:two-component system sensor histidine kinase UhpB|uniref:HAMP domain-containing sensor histidine kinase n=1 Tax=Pseudomonas sp. (strain SCT) TaxID=412955 RepID=UPI000EC9A023|nr:sensor histidine kinase [Pseudomonas sp. SCT]GCA57516.1 sensor histidine kinase LiaS [Pseudomonas sp. SCT]